MMNSTTIIDRIYNIMLSLRGQMIPTEIILSPELYQSIIDEQNMSRNTGEENTRLMLENHFSIPISIREEDTDMIIAKELFPNPCPVCGRRIPFLREMIERLESCSVDRVSCPLGHRYEGQIKIYHLNILQQKEESSKSEDVETCPACGSENIQHLSPTDVFCFDCEWDNLKSI